MNQRYTNNCESSAIDEDSQLTDSYIQTSQFQSTTKKSQGLLESAPPIDIRFNQGQ